MEKTLRYGLVVILVLETACKSEGIKQSRDLYEVTLDTQAYDSKAEYFETALEIVNDVSKIDIEVELIEATEDDSIHKVDLNEPDLTEASSKDITNLDPVDEYLPDAIVEDENSEPNNIFCKSFANCGEDEVCIFSEGTCEKRSTWVDQSLGLYGFHPPQGASGDYLVIDGFRFYANIFPIFTVWVGSHSFSGMQIDPQPNENRVSIPVKQGMSGLVSIVDQLGKKVTLPFPFQQSVQGIIECDGSTPMATNVKGKNPTEVGPYAAGYVDIFVKTHTRIYYPAKCGSVRRPPEKGKWPLVCILHGNGALNVQYEYLAELLATWGFLSFAPATKHNGGDYDVEEMLDQLLPVIKMMRGKALDDVHMVLQGVSTTNEIAFIGHSRGAGRIEEALEAEPELKPYTKAVIFLGPSEDDKIVPGYLMVFGGGKDKQSFSPWYNMVYEKHGPPHWLIEIAGGNHGGFCDHKVYGYSNVGLVQDLPPTISRHRQLEIVQMFSVPLLQRAFGLEEMFASYLDDPPKSPDYKVQFEK